MNKYFIAFLFLFSFHYKVNAQLINTSGTDLVFNGAVDVVVNNMDFTNNGSTTLATTSNTYLIGTTNMTISGSTTTTFGNITINKSNSASSVALSTGINVATNATFTAGNVVSSSSAYMVFNAGSSVSGASDVSHVNGPVKKIGATDFTFPVGNATYYRQASVTALSGSETYTAQYYFASPRAVYGNNLESPIHHISEKEYWIIDRAGAANAKVTLSWNSNTSGSISTISDLVVARYDGTSQWKHHNGTSHTGTTSAGTVITPALVTSFSPFTLATTVAASLPISLLNLETKCEGNLTNISWRTASEENNDFFTVQKSYNGVDFFDYKKLKGHGTSNAVHQYQITDVSGDKSAYYRLKNIDFDGTTYLSTPVHNSCENNLPNFQIINVSDNGQGHIEGLFNSAIEGEYEVAIYNTLGEIVVSDSFIGVKGNNTFSVTVNSVASGMYYLSITQSAFRDCKKLVLAN